MLPKFFKANTFPLFVFQSENNYHSNALGLPTSVQIPIRNAEWIHVCPKVLY